MGEFKVLVVDDEADFLETIVRRLQRRDIDAAGVDSGEKAIEFLERQEVDVVILDVRMKGMDGIDTLKELKKRWPKVEVVMLTGHGSYESGIEGMQLGAYDYIMKPAKFDELIIKVRQAYERKLIEEKKISP
jgi:two-component system OmpR family response regulator